MYSSSTTVLTLFISRGVSTIITSALHKQTTMSLLLVVQDAGKAPHMHSLFDWKGRKLYNLFVYVIRE